MPYNDAGEWVEDDPWAEDDPNDTGDWFADNSPESAGDFGWELPPTVWTGGLLPKPDFAKIKAAYQKYLGRPGSETEWFSYARDPNFESNIYRSDEARAYRQGHPQAATTNTGGGTFTGDLQGLWTQYRQAHPDFKPRQSVSGSLKPFVDWANSQGANISLAAPSSGGYEKGIMTDGHFVKLLDGYDNPMWSYDDNLKNEGAKPAQTDIAQIPGLAPGSLLQPFQEQFTQPKFEAPPDFEAPPAFVAPTAEEAMQAPGVQAQLALGREALERSAAAKGTLLTTGTLKNLDQFSQGVASQAYGDVYGRKLGEWTGDYARKAGEYESKYGKKAENFERDYNQALGEYGIRKGNFYEGQDRPFNKLTTLAGFGTLPPVNYAGQYGNLQMYGANNAGNFLTQGANAQAAGQVGASNAWNDAFSNLGNLGMQTAYQYSNPWQQRAPYGQGYGVLQ